MFQISLYGGSDRGLVRENNEDSIAFTTFDEDAITLALVADGVGGHAGGEVASRLAVDSIMDFMSKAVLQASSGGGYSEQWLKQILSKSLNWANKTIFEQQSQQPAYSNMATTIVAVLVKDATLALSYLGDSRCYRWRDHTLQQLTHDHTVAMQMFDAGALSDEEYQQSPYHHIINHGLGLSKKEAAEETLFDIQDKDFYLLCSDGLTNSLTDLQIAAILDDSEDITNCVDELITCANDAGGKDNISVVMLECKAVDEPVVVD